MDGDKNDQSTVKAAVIGGGLVGALQACYLAKRGFQVDLYEGRQDIRTVEEAKGRSINLALSVRGRAALHHVGLEEEITAAGIPMRARRIHNRAGGLHNQPYDKDGQAIFSVSRRNLNEKLLTKAESFPNVKLHFQHRLVRADLDKGELQFTTSSGDTVTATHDITFGADGAYSAMRRELMRGNRINFSQEYIPHGYMELKIPPTEDGGFAMLPNFLHIWPRDEFMMIALPNQDHTFTGTLFVPFAIFEKVQERGEDGVIEFFTKNFPDAIPLIGEESLKNTFMSTKALPMVSVKCYPYHRKDKAVLMGDAAHAMVPFYGQGMNCGFEDCVVLDEILNKHNNNFKTALPEFSQVRSPDAQAMCDLALYNYVEMRHLVNSKLFMLNKKIDDFLYWLLPKSYMPLYNMVTFSRIRYSIVISKWKQQKKFVRFCLISALFALPMIAGTGYWQRSNLSGHRRFNFHWRNIRWEKIGSNWQR
ncbi:kynurenine 3-monooxygenase-like [Apostichopus japonicus]|uniref:kynurenine 3-monooxygenase-like n=1 Tax=Stichopus japonicus TaxID=307972 RepID=UPI003AB6B6EE